MVLSFQNFSSGLGRLSVAASVLFLEEYWCSFETGRRGAMICCHCPAGDVRFPNL